MLEIDYTDEFKKRYADLQLPIKKKAEKQEKLFRHNPFHPSLNTEKIEPKGKQLWTFRVDKKYRVVFKFIGPSHARLLTVGPHDWIYKLIF